MLHWSFTHNQMTFEWHSGCGSETTNDLNGEKRVFCQLLAPVSNKQVSCRQSVFLRKDFLSKPNSSSIFLKRIEGTGKIFLHPKHIFNIKQCHAISFSWLHVHPKWYPKVPSQNITITFVLYVQWQ